MIPIQLPGRCLPASPRADKSKVEGSARSVQKFGLQTADSREQQRPAETSRDQSSSRDVGRGVRLFALGKCTRLLSLLLSTRLTSVTWASPRSIRLCVHHADRLIDQDPNVGDTSGLCSSSSSSSSSAAAAAPHLPERRRFLFGASQPDEAALDSGGM